jgi:hypothetical protein
MPRSYPDLKLISAMTSKASYLHEAAGKLDACLTWSIETDQMASESARRGDENTFDANLSASASDSAKARAHLVKFDKHLADLIALRGQLAEAIDLPMFSHISSEARYPDREALDM